jgi:hypothetical protein
MTSKIRSIRVSPATILSCVALFLALTGSALAVGIAKNSVRSPQIADGTVRTVDVHDGAINTQKIAPGAVGKEQLAENSVDSLKVENESLTNQDLGPASVGTSEVADQSLTEADLGPNSVGSSELQGGSIRASELGPIIQTSETATVKSGANVSVSANCPAGTVVISGGSNGGVYGIHLASTFRSENGWRIDARNDSSVDSSVTVHAYCLTGGSSN